MYSQRGRGPCTEQPAIQRAAQSTERENIMLKEKKKKKSRFYLWF